MKTMLVKSEPDSLVCKSIRGLATSVVKILAIGNFVVFVNETL